MGVRVPARYTAALVRLGDALVSIGGHGIVVDDATIAFLALGIADRGQPHEAPVRRVEGVVRECHAQVVALWRRGEVDRVCSGFALADDGRWWSHTWGVDADGSIVETTPDVRIAYFGVEWSPDGDRGVEWFATAIETGDMIIHDDQHDGEDLDDAA